MMQFKVAAYAITALAATQVPSVAAAQTRDLSTDRPDKTESAYTVPAQAWQLEMDLVNFTRNEDGGVTTESLAVAPFNIKYGLSSDTDIQVVVAPYVREEQNSAGLKTREDGFGEVTVRLKHNFWGNDGGQTAFAVMPFITLPTADDDFGGSNSIEGGVILPLAVSLGDRLGAGFMAQVNALKDASDNYAPEFVLSGTLGADLTEQVGAYFELYGSRFDDAGEKL